MPEGPTGVNAACCLFGFLCRDFTSYASSSPNRDHIIAWFGLAWYRLSVYYIRPRFGKKAQGSLPAHRGLRFAEDLIRRKDPELYMDLHTYIHINPTWPNRKAVLSRDLHLGKREGKR